MIKDQNTSFLSTKEMVSVSLNLTYFHHDTFDCTETKNF